MEKDEKKGERVQKDDPLWMYRSALVKRKDQARRDSQAAVNNQKMNLKPIENKGLDQTIEKTEIYCANNKLNAKINPNCCV